MSRRKKRKQQLQQAPGWKPSEVPPAYKKGQQAADARDRAQEYLVALGQVSDRLRAATENVLVARKSGSDQDRSTALLRLDQVLGEARKLLQERPPVETKPAAQQQRRLPLDLTPPT